MLQSCPGNLFPVLNRVRLGGICHFPGGRSPTLGFSAPGGGGGCGRVDGDAISTDGVEVVGGAGIITGVTGASIGGTGGVSYMCTSAFGGGSGTITSLASGAAAVIGTPSMSKSTPCGVSYHAE